MCPATALQPPRDPKAWGPRSRPAALLRGGKRLQPWGATRWAAGTLGTADWAEDREAARPRRRSLTTGRRDSAPGVRDRARRSLRARLERVPSELSEPLSSEITMKSSMAAGPGRASARVAGWPATLAAAATSVPAAEAAAAATNLAITLPAPPLNRLNSSSPHGLVAIEFLRDVPSPEVAILFLATSPSFGMTLRNLFAHLMQGFLIIFVRAATYINNTERRRMPCL